MMNEIYFAQLNDLHIGSPEELTELNKIPVGFSKMLIESAEQNFIEIIKEINALPFSSVLFTADLVNVGTELELKRYLELSSLFQVPVYHTPANHDMEKDPGAGKIWEKLLGKRQHCFDEGELRIVMMCEYGSRSSEGKWYERMEDLSWLDERLKEWSPKPSLLTRHSPSMGPCKQTDKLLDILSKHNVIGILTGHMHFNNEWLINTGDGKKVRLINTGSAMGQQWTNIPPYRYFPTRPGYRMLSFYEGKLRSFWREIRIEEQANLVWIGPVHTKGPRPQVLSVEVFSKVQILAQSFARIGEIIEMEWCLCSECGQIGWKILHAWSPMNRIFSGLWSDWEAELNPEGFNPGQYALVVRAKSNRSRFAYDAVPIIISAGRSSIPAKPGRDIVFELFLLPKIGTV